MKTLAILTLALLASVTTASAQTTGFVEGQFHIVDGKTVATMDALTSTPLIKGGKWSVDTWGLKTDGWGEVLIGVGRSLTPWASVSASVGVEESDGLWRTGYSLWLSDSKTSALFLYEIGDSGWWHKVVITREVTHGFRAGVASIRFVGTGPYAEVKVGKVSLWVTAPVVGGKGALTGVRMGF